MKRSLISATAVALAFTFFGTLGTAQAAQPVPTAPAGDLVKLVEYRSQGDAYYYSTGGSAPGGFDRNNGSGVIGQVHSRPGPGRLPLHQLKFNGGGSSYMLSLSSNEGGKFSDTGVIGYVDTSNQGGQAKLLRFSNNNRWRAFPDHAPSVATMKGNGWNQDGDNGLGYVTP
ncbi:hypothetical protein [Pseudonocardia spinosispora]|uniref:hypothetical protein n=1 Tax=Pseudonocardia spinosispora TaxID=103441 RepID=UPI0003F8B392|nr:hypothetical protein [Pseudonocardia spinosispora]